MLRLYVKSMHVIRVWGAPLGPRINAKDANGILFVLIARSRGQFLLHILRLLAFAPRIVVVGKGHTVGDRGMIVVPENDKAAGIWV